MVLFNSLHNWACRDGALNKTPVEDGVTKVVIVLSDSTNGTSGGDTKKSARYCQCGGEKRLKRIVPEATDNRAKQVLVHVHGHVRRNGAVVAVSQLKLCPINVPVSHVVGNRREHVQPIRSCNLAHCNGHASGHKYLWVHVS